MDVKKLEQLADTIRNGHYVFQDMKVAFSMRTIFTRVKHDDPLACFYLEGRDDLKGVKFNCAACLVGTTLILNDRFSMLSMFYDKDFNMANCVVEAQCILGLGRHNANNLFFGMMLTQVTGEQTAMVIRKLIQNGKVDWYLPYR